MICFADNAPRLLRLSAQTKNGAATTARKERGGYAATSTKARRKAAEIADSAVSTLQSSRPTAIKGTARRSAPSSLREDCERYGPDASTPSDELAMKQRALARTRPLTDSTAGIRTCQPHVNPAGNPASLK